MELVILFFAIIIILGSFGGIVLNFLIEKCPSLETIFIAEDVDRDGNPINEDF